MNLSSLFIQRPVMTTLVMIGILIFGIIGYTQLPLLDLPNGDYPVILVSANLPGASPANSSANSTNCTVGSHALNNRAAYSVGAPIILPVPGFTRCTAWQAAQVIVSYRSSFG